MLDVAVVEVCRAPYLLSPVRQDESDSAGSQGCKPSECCQLIVGALKPQLAVGLGGPTPNSLQ